MTLWAWACLQQLTAVGDDSTDPHKTSRMRVVNRAYRALDSAGTLERDLEHDTALRNATRFFLKNGE